MGLDEHSDMGADEHSDMGLDEHSDMSADEHSDMGADEHSDMGLVVVALTNIAITIAQYCYSILIKVSCAINIPMEHLHMYADSITYLNLLTVSHQSFTNETFFQSIFQSREDNTRLSKKRRQHQTRASLPPLSHSVIWT